MPSSKGLTIGAAARLAGLTVRTLHHYDAIGLVSPRQRSQSGYRLYGVADVARLQEVLFFRELGFGLEQIKQIMARPGYDRTSALRRQRELLEAKAERLLGMVALIDKAIISEGEGNVMTNEEMLEVFDGFDPSQYEEEVKQRWGDTEAYRQSSQRTAAYRKQDWQQIKQEGEAINAAFVQLMQSGASATSEQALALAEQHRAHISKWFYGCDHEMHAGLGRMYVEDSRFTQNIDQAAPGLAAYMAEAFAANAEGGGRS